MTISAPKIPVIQIDKPASILPLVILLARMICTALPAIHVTTEFAWDTAETVTMTTAVQTTAAQRATDAKTPQPMTARTAMTDTPVPSTTDV